jgi:uncharacterized membrane protein HdeD (DUF308 family)
MSRTVSPGTLDVLTHNWWSLVARGVAAILFGAAVFAAPGLTLDGLAGLFAAYVLADGGLTLVAGLQERARGQGRSALLLSGLAGLAIGALTLLWTDRTVGSLLTLIGMWAVAVGALQIVAVLRTGRFRRGEPLLAGAGAVSAAFGALLLASPALGVYALGVAIALYALGSGGLLIALGRRLRQRARRAAMPAPHAAPAGDLGEREPTLAGR